MAVLTITKENFQTEVMQFGQARTARLLGDLGAARAAWSRRL